jgi:geranylgeranyl pyrophosphate synthase
MRYALWKEGGDGQIKPIIPNSWVQLPSLCCQAAGGDPKLADDFSAAWYYLYTAANLMDNIQDGDQPAEWQRDLSPAVSLNVATGLFFLSALELSRVTIQYQSGHPRFYERLLQMCSGQHLDLISSEIDLAQYWRIARAKSGDFFALGCEGGAVVSNCADSIIQKYGEYGQALGTLIQLRDDLAWIQGLGEGNSNPDPKDVLHSLPVVYGLEVSPPDQRSAILEIVQKPEIDRVEAQKLTSILDSTGAVLYIMMELARLKQAGLEALAQTNAAPPAREFLAQTISDLADR